MRFTHAHVALIGLMLMGVFIIYYNNSRPILLEPPDTLNCPSNVGIIASGIGSTSSIHIPYILVYLGNNKQQATELCNAYVNKEFSSDEWNAADDKSINACKSKVKNLKCASNCELSTTFPKCEIEIDSHKVVSTLIVETKPGSISFYWGCNIYGNSYAQGKYYAECSLT